MTSKDFLLVPLGEIVLPVERPETPIVGKRYRQIGVKLWGEGAYERESIDGSQTQYKTLSCVEADDIILNKIWARNGSVSVVPTSLAGCYVSGEFPTFAPIREKLEPRWFYWLTKTKYFWEQCDEKSRGTSGKNRIKPAKFLEVLIPLPSLEEQRRIVARIEKLVGKIEDVRSLRQNAIEETEILYRSYLSSLMRPNTDKWQQETISKSA
ncbi:MAG: restriction endonuclease subunit S [Trichormus sp.]